MLLGRYGILFRDLLARESNIPKWRDLLGILRRLEARGEVRGGRFVTGFGGEQFALPQAVESLRTSRTRDCDAVITVAAADPINLVGIVIPGDRVSAIPGKHILYRNGQLHFDESTTESNATSAEIPTTLIPTLLHAQTTPDCSPEPSLFQL
jgi:ATP-dependent Lhr-like helicase